MSSSLKAIQQAIYERLTADTVLMGKITGVFDEVPQNQPFPYVTIGDMTSTPWRTMSRFGEEVTITLHIWSQQKGFREAYEILDDLNRLLADQVIPVLGWDVAACWYEFSDTIRDPDGVTKHIPVRYRMQVQKQ